MIKPLFLSLICTAALFAGTQKCYAERQPANAIQKLGLAYEAASRHGNGEKALSLLYNLENEIPELRSYVFFIRGIALDTSANPLAADMYRIAASENPLRTAALEKQAEALEKTGLPEKAEKIYETLLREKTARGDFYLKKLAEIAEKQGRKKAAAKIWERLWTAYPSSAFTGESETKIEQLTGSFSPPAETSGKRADKLFSMKKWTKALSAYRTLPETPHTKTRRAACIYIKGGKNPQKLKKALSLLTDVQSAEATYRKGVVLEKIAKRARSKNERRKHLLKAARVFRSVHDRFAGSKWAGKALVKEQEIALKLGKTREAQQIYQILKQSHPSHREDAAWNAGWAFYRKGEYAKAGAIFSENSRPETGVLSGQFKYWRAKILEKTGSHGEAQKLFAETAKGNFSYYSFLASRKTETVRAFAKPAKNPAGSKTSPAIKRAELLLKAGLVGWAKREAENEARSSPAACSVLAATGDFHSCIKLSAGYPPPEDTRLSFPKGFEKEVKRFAAKYGIEENLVYSVIREESRFVPDAVSHADAFGLMQLIMPTAKEVAAATGRGEITREKLFLPELNIELGTFYLSLMLKKFNGNTAAALSAYNAGPSRTKKWKNGILKNLEQDEFSESIPFDETRNYVRRIMRSYGVYSAVYPPG